MRDRREPLDVDVSPRATPALMISGAVLANLAFLGLGASFDYPDVLDRPPADVLAQFRAGQWAVGGWFVLLAASAAMLAPIALGVGRLAAGRGRSPAERNQHVADDRGRRRTGRAIVALGVAAAAVQVVGLLRWPVVVPFLARRAADPQWATGAAETFDQLGTVLGTVVGETFGYLLTAAWTALVVWALRGVWLSRTAAGLGLVSAGFVLAGVAVPVGLPGADTANFVGYLLWTVWLVVVAVGLWRRVGSAAGRWPFR